MPARPRKSIQPEEGYAHREHRSKDTRIEDYHTSRRFRIMRMKQKASKERKRSKFERTRFKTGIKY